MRPDEQFAVDCLREAVPDISSVTEGENPPDCYFVVNGRRTAIEITRLTPITYDRSGAVQNRFTQDAHAMRLVEDLDASLGPRLPEGIRLIVHVVGPIRNPNRFRTHLTSLVVQYSGTKQLLLGRMDYFPVAGNEVGIFVEAQLAPPHRRIVGMVANEDANLWVGADARRILDDRLATKTRLMSASSWQGPAWLVLINDHPLADVAEFAAAYDESAVAHTFSYVVLVCRDKRVFFLRKAA